MPRPKTLEPKYRHHKASGRAYVVLDGKPVYLGKYGTAASRNRYYTALSEGTARGHQGPLPTAGGASSPTISMVLAAFLRHAQAYYKSANGTESDEIRHFRRVMRLLKNLYGATPAAEFGPLKLKAVRTHMLRPRKLTDPITGKVSERPGWSRSYANHQVGRAKMIFKWAVENELVPASVHHGLTAVSGLRKGRCEARETKPVKPGPEQLIDPVRDPVSPQVRAMIDLQLLTGARPGELCRMRSCDVDTTPAVWVYRPESHKTAHHGHRREIFIGPKAQQVLRPLLKPDFQAYVFSPADAERARAEKLREARKTPVQPSQQRRAERAKRRRRRRAPTDRYDVAAYRRAIARACARAFPSPEHLARNRGETAKAWRARLSLPRRSGTSTPPSASSATTCAVAALPGSGSRGLRGRGPPRRQQGTRRIFRTFWFPWVVLTNAIAWRLYHVIFSKPIDKQLVAEVDLLAIEPRKEADLARLFPLTREGCRKGLHEELRDRQAATSRFLLAALLTQNEAVAGVIRRELRRVVDVNVSEEEVLRVLAAEVIKRDALEGPEAEAAAKRVNRSEARKIIRVAAGRPTDQNVDLAPPTAGAPAGGSGEAAPPPASEGAATGAQPTG